MTSNCNRMTLETDVLVVGGGIAGIFAAIYAQKQGVHVTLVDKGHVGFSGLSPWFHGFAVYDESKDVTKEQWMDKFLAATEYITLPGYVDMFFDHSMEAWNDMVAWGATDNQANGGQAPKFRQAVEQSGVTMVERTMITELLKVGERVVGAIGFQMESGTPVIIHAKNTILCAGSGTFKTPGWPAAPNTFDSHIMAYRAGATLAGKEWNDFHGTNLVHPSYTTSNCTFYNSLHAVNEPLGHSMRHIFWSGRNGIHTKVTEEDIANLTKDKRKVTKGDGPPPKPPVPGPPKPGEVSGAACGASEHRCDGVFPTNDVCFSGVPGLYAAGDALCTGGVGLAGSAAPGCAVQGMVSGRFAAEECKKMEAIRCDDQSLQQAEDLLLAPLHRELGYSGQYVIQLLQSIMCPYYVLFVKEQSRMEAALSNVLYLKSHFLPLLVANDAHELRNAHEAVNIVVNAEMKLRASLFRTESRASHYREDIPVRKDDQWLAWVTIQDKDGEMIVEKEMIDSRVMPKEEHTYLDRYPDRFPLELDYVDQV